MAFTPQFLDEIRARVPLSDVIGRRVRLIRKGREHSARARAPNDTRRGAQSEVMLFCDGKISQSPSCHIDLCTA